jgi:hypothetical protein
MLSQYQGKFKLYTFKAALIIIKSQFIDDDKATHLAEVLYFIARKIGNDLEDDVDDVEDAVETAGNIEALAVISLYGPPNNILLETSSQTYWSVTHLRDTGIRVINAMSIVAVVAMVPDRQYQHWRRDGTEEDRWMLVEKPGLKLMQRILQYDEQIPEDGDGT